MTHPGDLKLRRFLAEEPLPAELVAHLQTCTTCGASLGRLREEQRAFEAEIPFERFAAGVEKAERVQRKGARPSRLRGVWALAAVLLAVVIAPLVLRRAPETRTKGGEVVDFVVAGVDGQRSAAPVEQLRPGERVRIGVTGHRYVTALSIDDRGEVSVAYAEAVEGTGVTWLPGSLEFTGAGREHVVVVLSDGPVASEKLGAQLKQRFQAAGGDVLQLGPLEVDGVQVHRTFIKP